MVDQDIITQVKMQMAAKGIKQQKLSERSGVDRSRISQILNGQNWTRNTMIKVLKALELNELITLLK